MSSLIEKKEGADLWPDAAPCAQNVQIDYPSVAQFSKNNNSEAVRFLSLLSEDEAFTFQTFDDKRDRRDPRLIRVLHGSLNQHFDELTRLNKAGAGIFVTINETDLQGREARNIKRVRAVFVDLDGASLAPIIQGPLEPHVTVSTSSGRFHIYWVIEDLPIEVFTRVQKALITRFQADAAVHDLPRVMRLPGFYHNKGEPYLVRIFSNSCTQPYKAVEFLEAFAIDPNETVGSCAPQLGLANDPILKELERRGMVKRPLPNHPGGWDIRCPFIAEHTTGEDGTAYFEAHTHGYAGSGFKCQHAHCVNRDINDLKKYLGINVDEEIWEEPLPLIEELLPVAHFELDMLPKALQPWILDIAERMQVPIDFLAVPAIVALGSLIGRKTGIYPKAHDDWLVVPNLWGGNCGAIGVS